jgi:hypothetical protein
MIRARLMIVRRDWLAIAEAELGWGHRRELREMYAVARLMRKRRILRWNRDLSDS